VEQKSKLHLATSQAGSSTLSPARVGKPVEAHDSWFAFQLLSYGGSDIVLIVSLDGRIVEANQAAVTAYQHDRSVLLSKKITDLRPAREVNRVASQLAEAQERGARFETAHCRADGSEFAVEVVSNPVVIGGATFLLNVVRDIADRKQTEQQVERQASLLDLASEPIFAWYLDGGISYWNKGAERLYGFSNEEALGKISHQLLKTKRLQDEADFFSTLRRERLWKGELRHTTKEGKEVVVESRQQVLEERDGRLLVLECNRDITDRKHVEDSLRLSEARYRALTELSSEAIYVANREGQYVLVNHRACELLGYSREELLTMRVNDVIVPRELERLERVREELLTGKTNVADWTLIRKDGTEVSVEVSTRILPDGRWKSLARDLTERKQAESELRLSEERYRALAHATSQIVWVTTESGLGRNGQGEWEAFTGCDSSGWNWLTSIHPDDRALTEATWRQAIATGETYSIKHRLRRHDGQYRDMQVRGIPVRDASGNIREWIGTHTDITEGKEAEAALAQSEAKLRMSLEAAQMGTWDWDVLSNQLVWDDRCKALFGLEPAAPMTYERFLAAVHPDDGARVDEAVQLAISRDADYDIEMRVPQDGGPVRWIRSKGRVFRDSFGRAVRMSGCALDVTERKEDEQALQQSEERFRLTFDQAAIGITHVGLDGRWLRVNQKLCDITGYSREELLQTDFQTITHPDDLESDLSQARRLLAGEINQYAMEKRYIRRDGAIVWVDLSVSLMRRPDGTPDHFISIIADISQRKLVEAELQDRREELEEAQRVGGLGSWSWEPDSNRLVWSAELYQIAGQDPAGPPPPFEEQGELYTPESWWRLQTMVRNALQTGGGYESDLEMVRPDGSHRWTAIRAEAEIDSLGKTRRLHGTVLDITQRKTAESALRKAHAELEDKVRERTAELAAVNQSLRVLTGRSLQLQDDERRRLSRDLHDSAGQMLVALSMNCAALGKEVHSSHGSQLIADTQALISQMSAEIRSMSYLLHPPLLDEVGLESALQWYVEGFSKRSGIKTRLEVSSDFGRLPKDQEITLFRVVQEALTNVLRHAESSTAAVRLRRDKSRVQVEITDAGKGIPTQRLERMHASGSQGVGLGGMRERISQLGGEFAIASTAQGTEIVATLPVG
jgi:PAS domain S-box-containing protein